ncbi:hypothetical protein [Naasia aerilata]|uniref:Antibiotic biosynthesis monooxygenase n=1 Tax=Naasia aerilata TaxID=1162966 RepID=A0ABM8GEE4_9MICO|nr:hypothetical protein [Naasia aerilata]BDZ46680.1 antibiotic biosynthesis monooxygenase [Naasia aerilata]
MTEVPAGTVVRTWTGWVRPEDRERYTEYVEATGLGAYRTTPGNLGAFLMYADEGDRTRITTISFWTDFDVIRGFAGDDISQAVFYPEDDEYLVARETTVTHAVVA